MHHEPLVDRLGRALLHLADEVLLEGDLRQVYPPAFGEPVDVARRNLRQRDERNAGVAEVGETQRVPRGLLVGLATVEHRADVVCGRRDHRLDHEPGLRCTGRHRGHLDGRDGHAHAHGVDVRKRRVALVLVDEHEAARVHEPLDADHGVDALEGRQHHRESERQLVRPLLLSHVVVFGHEHLPGFHARGLRVADPLDVAIAHGRFEQRLRIADAAESEMPDVGLGRHERHRDPIADLPPTQVGVHDESELVCRAVA